jgi:hypothetical protein
MPSINEDAVSQARQELGSEEISSLQATEKLYRVLRRTLV